MSCPHKYVLFDEKENARIKADFEGYTDGLSASVPEGWCAQPRFQKVAHKFYNYKLRGDDVWIVTYPKTGTTWTQEMTWCIMNNVDLEKAKTAPIMARSPFIEINYVMSQSVADGMLETMGKLNVGKHSMLEASENLTSPRVLKSHLALSQLNPDLLNTCKVIYVARNPKDTMVSYYHHHRLMKGHGYIGDFATFVDYFMKDELLNSPFWRHLLTAWERRDHPNMLYIFYEEMKKDLSSVVDRVCKFVNRKLSDEQKAALLEHLKFDSMKKNKTINLKAEEFSEALKKGEGEFIRKGKTGDWKNYFTPELNEKVDKWIAENLKNSTLSFTMEL